MDRLRTELVITLIVHRRRGNELEVFWLNSDIHVALLVAYTTVAFGESQVRSVEVGAVADETAMAAARICLFRVCGLCCHGVLGVDPAFSTRRNGFLLSSLTSQMSGCCSE